MNLLGDKNILKASVINIYWERINLFIDVKIEKLDNSYDTQKLDFYLVNGLRYSKAHFEVISNENGVYRLYLNITNPGYNRCLARGTYNIHVCCGENDYGRCVVDESIVTKMSDFSRSFLYGNRGSVYNVVFYISDDDDNALPFVMYTMASKATSIGNLNPISLSLKEKEIVLQSFAGRIKKRIFKRIKSICDKFVSGEGAHRRRIKLIYKTLSKKLEIDGKTILFMSEQNPYITANQKAVYDRMVSRGLDKEWTILTSFRPAASEKQGFKSWLSLLKKMARSNVIVLDDHAPVLDWLMLNKKTKVIQLWHAGAGFKSSGYSRWGNSGCPSPFSCHRQYTYGIAGSKRIAHFFSEVWGINTEQVLPTGMPRMDEFLDENYRKKTTEKIYELYPMCKSKKVILFAPTYRGRNKSEAHYPYELIDFEALYNLCKDEYVVLFKMHPWVQMPVPIDEKYKDKFIDIGTYPNINDLFYITELLITDYSSNIFEYSLMKKPMLFFAYDEIQYSFSRGFHRDYKESAPGKIVHNFTELLSAIENNDFEYEKVQEYIDEHFDYIDSNASDRVIDWLILDDMPENMKKSIDAKFNDAQKTALLDFEPELAEELTEDFD